jgi:hypothetical protein
VSCSGVTANIQRTAASCIRCCLAGDDGEVHSLTDPLGREVAPLKRSKRTLHALKNCQFPSRPRCAVPSLAYRRLTPQFSTPGSLA